MATWQAIVNGTTYSLSDGNPFKILSISGIGNAPVRRLEERGPFQDGATDIGYRLDARLINIQIQIVAASLSAADTHRDTLSTIFNPRGGQTIYLRCTRDDSAVRQIDCYVVNMLDMPAELGQRDIAAQRVGVQLKAPNPIWYNPTQTITTLVPTSPPAWYTAMGLIGTANVVAQGTAITPGAAWTGGFGGSVDSFNDWSICVRANGRSSAADYLFFFRGLLGQQNYIASNAGTASGTATLTLNNSGVYINMAAGTSTYILTYQISVGSAALYENGSAIYAGNPGSYGIALGSAWWGGTAGNTWDTTITHASAYNKVLSSEERTSLMYAIDNAEASTTMGTVTNSGSWDEFPQIAIMGSVVSPVVKNVTTDENIDFTGATISANTFYTIDTRYGYKTVTDSNAVNQITKLSDDSDLSTWHLVPGANVVEITTVSPGTVTITHYDRYLGL